MYIDVKIEALYCTIAPVPGLLYLLRLASLPQGVTQRQQAAAALARSVGIAVVKVLQYLLQHFVWQVL